MNPIGFIDYTGLVQVLKAVKSKIDGIIVKLNGSETNVNSTDIDIYVPTDSGTSGQYLKSNGEGKAPTWSTISPSSSSGEGSYSAGTGISISEENVISLSPVKKADANKSPVDTNTYSCQASVELFAKNSSLGQKGGIATLDDSGKIPAAQLPSFVDDVIEGYLNDGHFYSDSSYTTLVTDETGSSSDRLKGKQYLDLPTNYSYRWTGSTYQKIESGAGYVLHQATETELGGIKSSKTNSSSVETGTVGGISQYQGVQVDKDGKAYVEVNGNLGYGGPISGTEITIGGGIYNNYGVDLSQSQEKSFTVTGTLANGLRYDVNIVNFAGTTKTVTIPAKYNNATDCVFNGSRENIGTSGLSFDIAAMTGLSLSFTYYSLATGNILFVTANTGLSTSAVSAATAQLN